MHEFIHWLLVTVQDWGYSGIFVLMALESTVLPVPSELVLIPAGYLAWQGEMNFSLIILASTLGSLLGASFNYLCALWIGRPFLEKYGRYFFVRPALLHKTDAFFVKHGAVSTFTGRLIPGIRHLISLPAGLTRMPFGRFAFYTCLGAGLWSVVLTIFGYTLGGNEVLIREYQHWIVAGALVFVAGVAGGYLWWQRRASPNAG